jgi:hypothetical protein
MASLESSLVVVASLRATATRQRGKKILRLNGLIAARTARGWDNGCFPAFGVGARCSLLSSATGIKFVKDDPLHDRNDRKGPKTLGRLRATGTEAPNTRLVSFCPLTFGASDPGDAFLVRQFGVRRGICPLFAASLTGLAETSRKQDVRPLDH